MDLELVERRGYVRMLAQRIQTENQAFEALTGQLRRG